MVRSATGTVVTFDHERGYGRVADAAGQEWFFHCTQIADGSRTITAGTQVHFDVVAGHLGRWEAVRLTPT